MIQVAAAGHLSDTGVDISAGVTIAVGSGSSAGVANVHYTLMAQTAEETTIVCTGGSIRLTDQGHAPTTLRVTRRVSRTESTTETKVFPLPEVETGGKFLSVVLGYRSHTFHAVCRCPFQLSWKRRVCV